MAALVNNSAKVFSTGNVSSLSITSFAVGGANRILYVFVASGAGSPTAPTDVKWGGSGGTALTQIGTTLSVGSFGRTSVWRLIAPTATTDDVYVDWGANQDETFIMAVAVEDADQSTPNGTVATGTGTSANILATAAAVVGDLVLGSGFFLDLSGSGCTLAVAGGQTALQEIEGADTNYEGLATSRLTAAGTSVAMSWTISGSGASTSDWGAFALAVNAAGGGGGGPTVKPLSALGVG